jgi:hypothetical protein
MTDEPKFKFKKSGPFLIPVDWEDETSERSGKPVAIIGGIQPKPPPAAQQPKRDDDKDKR